MILNSTYAFVTLALKVLICIQGSYLLTHDMSIQLYCMLSYSGPKAIRAVETSEEKEYQTRHAI